MHKVINFYWHKSLIIPRRLALSLDFTAVIKIGVAPAVQWLAMRAGAAKRAMAVVSDWLFSCPFSTNAIRNIDSLVGNFDSVHIDLRRVGYRDSDKIAVVHDVDDHSHEKDKFWGKAARKYVKLAVHEIQTTPRGPVLRGEILSLTDKP